MSRKNPDKKILRRVLRIGDSLGITLPKDFLAEDTSFVWVLSTSDGDIIIRPAQVR